MLIELKSSSTDPMNTASRMLQRFKETLILKPNSMVSLHSALITTNAESYAVLLGTWSHDGYAGTTTTFNETGATAFWKYYSGATWWRPTTGNNWLIFNAEPVAFGTPPTQTASLNRATNTITISDGGILLVKDNREITRKYIKDHTAVAQTDDNVILVNLPNFPLAEIQTIT